MNVKVKVFAFTYFLFGFYLSTFLPTYFNVDIKSVIVFYRISVVVLAVLMFLVYRQHKKMTVYLLSLLLFFGFYLIKVFYYTNFTNQNFNLPPNYFYFYSIGIVILPMLVFYSCFDDVSTDKLLNFAFYPLFFTSALSLIFNYTNLITGIARVNGNEHINTLSYGYFSIALVILSYFRLYNRSSILFLSVCGICFGLLNMVLSGSRGPLVSLIIIVLLVVFVFDKNRRYRNVKITLATTVLIALSVYIYRNTELLVVERFSDSFNQLNGPQTATRIILWREAYFEFANNIIWGGSIELPHNAIYPHQILLEILMSTGLLGFLLFSFPFLKGIKTAIHLLREQSQYSWLALLYIHFFIMMMFSFSMISVGMFWYLMVFLLGFNNQKAVKL